MIKVSFEKTEVCPNVELSTYNSISRIPFSIKIGSHSNLPETIYARNLSGENFIEFRFDQNTNRLYEITLVTIQDNTVFNIEGIKDAASSGNYYSCLITRDSELDSSTPMKIYRNSHCIKVVFEKIEANTNYFSLHDNYKLGVNSNGALSSIILTSLNEQAVLDIFGF